MTHTKLADNAKTDGGMVDKKEASPLDAQERSKAREEVEKNDAEKRLDQGKRHTTELAESERKRQLCEVEKKALRQTTETTQTRSIEKDAEANKARQDLTTSGKALERASAMCEARLEGEKRDSEIKCDNAMVRVRKEWQKTNRANDAKEKELLDLQAARLNEQSAEKEEAARKGQEIKELKTQYNALQNHLEQVRTAGESALSEAEAKLGEQQRLVEAGKDEIAKHARMQGECFYHEKTEAIRKQTETETTLRQLQAAISTKESALKALGQEKDALELARNDFEAKFAREKERSEASKRLGEEAEKKLNERMSSMQEATRALEVQLQDARALHTTCMDANEALKIKSTQRDKEYAERATAATANESAMRNLEAQKKKCEDAAAKVRLKLETLHSKMNAESAEAESNLKRLQVNMTKLAEEKEQIVQAVTIKESALRASEEQLEAFKRSTEEAQTKLHEERDATEKEKKAAQMLRTELAAQKQKMEAAERIAADMRKKDDEERKKAATLMQTFVNVEANDTKWDEAVRRRAESARVPIAHIDLANAKEDELKKIAQLILRSENQDFMAYYNEDETCHKHLKQISQSIESAQWTQLNVTSENIAQHVYTCSSNRLKTKMNAASSVALDKSDCDELTIDQSVTIAKKNRTNSLEKAYDTVKKAAQRYRNADHRLIESTEVFDAARGEAIEELAKNILEEARRRAIIEVNEWLGPHVRDKLEGGTCVERGGAYIQSLATGKRMLWEILTEKDKLRLEIRAEDTAVLARKIDLVRLIVDHEGDLQVATELLDSFRKGLSIEREKVEAVIQPILISARTKVASEKKRLAEFLAGSATVAHITELVEMVIENTKASAERALASANDLYEEYGQRYEEQIHAAQTYAELVSITTRIQERADNPEQFKPAPKAKGGKK